MIHTKIMPSAFVVVGRFAPDEERLVLSKPVVQFSFTYGVSRGIFIFICTSITNFFIYHKLQSISVS